VDSELCVHEVFTYTRRYNPLVMIRIDAYRVTLEIKRVLAVLEMFELVLMQIRPAPDARINDMREPFASCNLQPAIQCTLYCHALARM
jgi:hypothetical protein